MLYEPAEVEMPEYCACSVLEIRRYVGQLLDEGGISAELIEVFRNLRGACRQFLSQTPFDTGDGLMVPGAGHRGPTWGMHDWEFNQALGELRRSFGVQVARLAISYRLDVEEPLARILPPPPD